MSEKDFYKKITLNGILCACDFPTHRKHGHCISQNALCVVPTPDLEACTSVRGLHTIEDLWCRCIHCFVTYQPLKHIHTMYGLTVKGAKRLSRSSFVIDQEQNT